MTKESIIENKKDSRYAIAMPFNYDRIYEAMDEYAKQQAIAFDNWKHKNNWVLFHEDCYVKAEWILTGEAGFDYKAKRADRLYIQFIEEQ